MHDTQSVVLQPEMLDMLMEEVKVTILVTWTPLEGSSSPVLGNPGSGLLLDVLEHLLTV